VAYLTRDQVARTPVIRAGGLSAAQPHPDLEAADCRAG